MIYSGIFKPSVDKNCSFWLIVYEFYTMISSQLFILKWCENNFYFSLSKWRKCILIQKNYLIQLFCVRLRFPASASLPVSFSKMTFLHNLALLTLKSYLQNLLQLRKIKIRNWNSFFQCYRIIPLLRCVCNPYLNYTSLHLSRLHMRPSKAGWVVLEHICSEMAL